MRIVQTSSARVLLGLLVPALAACGGAVNRSSADGQTAAVAPITSPRVLITGGGSSHDYNRWFRTADSTTLAGAGARVTYVDAPDAMLPALAGVDVLYMTTNQTLPDPRLRTGIIDLANRGVGIMVGHAGAWFNNWDATNERTAPDWPEYHRMITSGGARSHPAIHEFAIRVVAPNHPVMQGVPASFTWADELYRFAADSTGARRTVLAVATDVATGIEYPVIYTVDNPRARIVVNTLGHDGRAHDRPEYQRILTNSLRWVTRQSN